MERSAAETGRTTWPARRHGWPGLHHSGFRQKSEEPNGILANSATRSANHVVRLARRRRLLGAFTHMILRRRRGIFGPLPSLAPRACRQQAWIMSPQRQQGSFRPVPSLALRARRQHAWIMSPQRQQGIFGPVPSLERTTSTAPRHRSPGGRHPAEFWRIPLRDAQTMSCARRDGTDVDPGSRAAPAEL
jgi:hypothetical protein